MDPAKARFRGEQTTTDPIAYDASAAEVQSRAESIVNDKKDRHRRVRSVTLEPRAVTHPAWAQVFTRAIGDRVTVKWRPPYGGTYSYPCYIIGIEHQWSQTSGMRTKCALQPVEFGTATGSPVFTLDSSLLDSQSRLAF